MMVPENQLDEEEVPEPTCVAIRLKCGDSYAPMLMTGPGTWQELLRDPEEHGDDVYLYHVADGGESPGIFDSWAVVRVRRAQPRPIRPATES